MRYLSDYLDYILETVKSNTSQLYYSEKFRSLLKKIENKSEVAKLLLLSERSNQVLTQYTLIDITDKNDTVSFVQVNRILRKYPEMEIDKELFTKGDYIKINGLIALLQNLTQTEETFSFEEPLYYGLANKDNINIITLEIEY